MGSLLLGQACAAGSELVADAELDGHRVQRRVDALAGELLKAGRETALSLEMPKL